MAGDWIPCELALFSKREVMTIARKTRRSRFEVAGLLLAFWGWFSTESADGTMPGVDIDSLADIIGADRKFWQAVADERWLITNEAGIEITNAERWITKGAKARLQKNRRQADWRGGNVDGGASTEPPTGAPTRPSRKASTTVQKRRENTNRRTQETGEGPTDPVGSAAETNATEPDSDTAGLTPEQLGLYIDLRDLTEERTGRVGYYRTIVTRLPVGVVHEIKSQLQQSVQDPVNAARHRGKLLTEIAGRLARERCGIRLFERAAA